MSNCLYSNAYACLMCEDPTEKVARSYHTYQTFQDDLLQRHTDSRVEDSCIEIRSIDDPGRPAKPELVSFRELEKRSLFTDEGRLVFAHAIAHIEFNAINLAWDAVYRFRDMPDDFYHDWVRVAKEEAYHFSLLRSYLQVHGIDYGEYSAHDGLWKITRQTDHDVLTRMALVPRVLEARGLDVTPKMIEKLTQAGDDELVAILRIILRDEVGHVDIGSRWFHYCCEAQHLDARQTFRQLLLEYNGAHALRGPFDDKARMQAGFSEDELHDIREIEVELYAQKEK